MLDSTEINHKLIGKHPVHTYIALGQSAHVCSGTKVSVVTAINYSVFKNLCLNKLLLLASDHSSVQRSKFPKPNSDS